MINIFNVIGKKNISHRSSMQTEKSQPSGQRIMPETRQTAFPAIYVYPQIAISLSASETDDGFYLSLFEKKNKNNKNGKTKQKKKTKTKNKHGSVPRRIKRQL